VGRANGTRRRAAPQRRRFVNGGRPRTLIGSYGTISVSRRGASFVALARFRDSDGRLRRVTGAAPSVSAARARLKERLLDRPGFGGGGVLDLTSSFRDLADLWLEDLDLQNLSDGTKENYRDDLRLHVLPQFEHFALGEITTGRVEWFLRSEAAVSYSRAKHSRTMLNLLFGFALRHDAIPRNPVHGTSPLRRPKGEPQALTLDQITAIRDAASRWRTGPDVKGPKPDGQVRDISEVLLGTALRIGECLALRVCDIEDGPSGMTISVTGTVVLRTGSGAVRQDHPKTEHSIRRIAVPDFAADVIRARLADMLTTDPERTVFANRAGKPLSPFNVRRTFRAFLELADLAGEGITLRWYRRTGATVIARGASADAAATFLGHGSTAITEGHYIEPDRTVDRGPAGILERTLRRLNPDTSLLVGDDVAGDDATLNFLDEEDIEAA